jgi:hypothetical protein
VRFKEEEHRVKQCLHPTTRENLLPILETTLITDKLERIHSTGMEMLAEEKIEGEFSCVISLNIRLLSMGECHTLVIDEY